MADPVLLHQLDARGVATLTLNRPAVNNAYDGELLRKLGELVEELAASPQVRLVVIRANGAHFQAGADLNWLAEVAQMDAAQNHLASITTALTMRRLNQLDKPTIALVQGACMGGGTGLIASCDIVIAESTASFAISEARWGMVATIIFPQLIGAIGIRQLRRYALTCERFDATQAQTIGLVHELCAPGQLDAAAAPLIDSLLRVAPGALVLSKRSALEHSGALVTDAEFARLVDEHATQRQSPEAAEGLASYFEKRPAKWFLP